MLRASDMHEVSLARGGRRKHCEVTASCRPRRSGGPGRYFPLPGDGVGVTVRMRRLLLVALVMLVTSCASTKVESTWSNPASRRGRSGASRSSRRPDTRQAEIEFEQPLTDALRKRGLDAIPGYQFVAYDEYPGGEEILRRVQAKGVQGALISKTIQASPRSQVNPVVVGGAVSSGWDAAGFYGTGPLR